MTVWYDLTELGENPSRDIVNLEEGEYQAVKSVTLEVWCPASSFPITAVVEARHWDDESWFPVATASVPGGARPTILNAKVDKRMPLVRFNLHTRPQHRDVYVRFSTSEGE